jgi:hypothetical protein
MKTLGAMGLCALAVLAAACGVRQPDDARRAPDTVVEVDDPPARPAEEVPTTRMELRLLGTQAQEGSTLLVSIRELRVTHAGRALPVEVARQPLDLANGQHAWLAGTFQVPEGADTVQVTLVLDTDGGFEDASGSGEVDVRGAPLRFEAPVKLLNTRRRAVVHLDVARSLLDGGAERKVLLPQFGVYY